MSLETTPADTERPVRLRITHRRYVDHGRAHYAGGLVDGGYIMGLFSDVATDVCIHADGDEGLLASYSTVTFHAPLRAGDVLEVTGEVTAVGRRSRNLELRAVVLARTDAHGSGGTSAHRLDQPLLVASAVGTVVVPGSR
jgi:3-aminobutyryl-CoA ammonia-lyase